MTIMIIFLIGLYLRNKFIKINTIMLIYFCILKYVKKKEKKLFSLTK